MRTIKELLVLLREYLPANTDTNFGYSVCFAIVNMYIGDIINRSERDALDAYVMYHRPAITGSFGLDFWWPIDQLAPRLEFLDKLIAEIDEN